MIRNLRERSLKSLGFIRSLCRELEICVRYTWKSESENCDAFFTQLLKRGHIIVCQFIKEKKF